MLLATEDLTTQIKEDNDNTLNISKQMGAPTENQASAEALVTNTYGDITGASKPRYRVREATRPCIFCNGIW